MITEASTVAIAMFPCLINSHSSTFLVERSKSFSVTMMPTPVEIEPTTAHPNVIPYADTISLKELIALTPTRVRSGECHLDDTAANGGVASARRSQRDRNNSHYWWNLISCCTDRTSDGIVLLIPATSLLREMDAMKRLAVVFTVMLCSTAWLIGDSSEPLEQLEGRVVAVTDGDTLTVLVNSTQHKVRLNAIDAPETGQDHGTKAKQYLAARVHEKVVKIDVSGQDRYGRLLGTVWLGPENINEAMISEGWAWHYKEYSKSPRLAQLEVEARQANRGLWEHPQPVSPWEYRSLQKRASAQQSNPVPREEQMFWLNTSTNVRHNSTCPNFKNTARGRFCSPNEGKACGRCGG